MKKLILITILFYFIINTIFSQADNLSNRITIPRSNKSNSVDNLKDNNTEKTTALDKEIYKADVDENIPVINESNPLRFALIIGNEDYNTYQPGLNSEVNVKYARNDAEIFRDYAVNLLGVPSENILLKVNCKVMEMNREIERMKLIAKNSNGKAELIFYYAGHGFPDEITREPYLMPVDVSATDLKYAIKLEDLYARLTEYPSQKVTIILDACFSGGARNQGLLAARGVRVKPKKNQLNGKLVVFSASSGDQSSLPYNEKQHGIFTYFLLKKLKETKGDISYEELSEYVSQTVSIKSLLINNKEQNPETITSATVMEDWKNWKFR